MCNKNYFLGMLSNSSSTPGVISDNKADIDGEKASRNQEKVQKVDVSSHIHTPSTSGFSMRKNNHTYSNK